MATVNVDRRLLWTLAGVAGLSLLAVAYLLGRASGTERTEPRSEGAAPAFAPVLAGTGANVVMTPAPTSPSADPAIAELPFSSAEHSSPDALPESRSPFLPTPDPEPGLTPPPEDPERAAVAAYLDAVDAIQASGLAGSPESAANEMAVALARGDASGLDGLVREAEEARRRLLAISPPAACAAHHRETVASFDDALGMLRALKAATGSTDAATALADVAARATALKARAESLKVEEEALRRRGSKR